jgi:hypothetical protein
MSKMRDVLSMRVAIDPSDVHVQTPGSKVLHEPKQRLSLLASHSSHARLVRTDRPSSCNALHSPEKSTEPSALRLRSLEKAKGRRYVGIDGASSAGAIRLVRSERTPDAPSNFLP